MKTKPISALTHLLNALTIGLALLWLLPLLFTLLMSVRPSASPVTNGNIFFDCTARPAEITLFGCGVTSANYREAWQLAPWLTHYRNSLIFVFGVLSVQFVTVTMAGYAFARMQFRGRDVLLNVILLQLMIPAGVLLVQNYSTINDLGLFNTHWALMLPYWVSAFGVLLLRQTFREVPYELEEAARIDGANWGQVMWNV
ncbi:MAG: carbohydrate ABC transporter permease, partial [Armatimonadetes bacterium]|nr:carbohydrate ABC transporter permease [Anaerolineae bacterium]